MAKAEASTEARFASVNEFRGQLSDQTRSFLTRNEYLTAHQGLIDKVDAVDQRLTERLSSLELRFTSRLDLGAGRDSGTAAGRDQQRLNFSAMVTVVAVVATIVSVILLALKK